MLETMSEVFTEDELDVLQKVLGFATGELEDENDLIESAKQKLYDDEPFDDDEILAIKVAMIYADNHMHRHYNVLAAQKLSDHYSDIEAKLDSMES